MDQNPQGPGGDINRPEGTAAGRVASPDGTPPQGYAPPRASPTGPHLFRNR